MNDTFKPSTTASAKDSSNGKSLFDTPISREGTGSVKWEKYAGQDIIPMWVADMDFAVAEPIQAALKERAQHPVFGYTAASPGLKESISDHLKKEYDWEIEHDWLVFLPGVVTGMAMCCRAYCDDNDQIMVNPPIYHHFFDAHDKKRQEILRVPLHKEGDRWTYDIKAMRSAVTAKTSMIMMCSPHNPTGTVFSADELKQVGNLAAENDMTIVSDEIHCDLVIDGVSKHIPTAVACPEHSDRIVTLMSASKTWNLAGLNISFAIIPNQQKREQFVNTCSAVVPMTTPFALTATEAAFRHGGPWRDELLVYLKSNYDRISAALEDIPGLKLQPLQATYLAWVDASDLKLNDTLAHFERHGVGLSSGEQFGQPQYLRINFACPASVLDEGLARMKKAVEALA